MFILGTSSYCPNRTGKLILPVVHLLTFNTFAIFPIELIYLTEVNSISTFQNLPGIDSLPNFTLVTFLTEIPLEGVVQATGNTVLLTEFADLGEQEVFSFTFKAFGKREILSISFTVINRVNWLTSMID